jgi:hypothetical protein
METTISSRHFSEVYWNIRRERLMATNFPTSLDTWPTIIDNTTRIDASYINNIQDAIEALEAKVGINSDTTNTLDYKMRNFFDRYTPRTLYFYNDTAPTNWSAVAGVGDSILAIKGGSTYSTGGAKAGSWAITGVDDDTHTHPWYYYSGSYGYTYDSGGSTSIMTNYTNVGESNPGNIIGVEADNYPPGQPSDAYTDVCKPTTGSYFYTNNDTHSHTHTGLWRPAGAIGILAQYDG